MEELIEKINAVTKEFMKNANAQVEKMMKEFRKVSLDASKN